jgi:hypothetical protein
MSWFEVGVEGTAPSRLALCLMPGDPAPSPGEDFPGFLMRIAPGSTWRDRLDAPRQCAHPPRPRVAAPVLFGWLLAQALSAQEYFP